MVTIDPYTSTFRDAVVDLSLRAWTPVFRHMREAVPAFVYRSFYPNGWEARQRADIAHILETEPHHTYVAVEDSTVLGWMSLRFHPERRHEHGHGGNRGRPRACRVQRRLSRPRIPAVAGGALLQGSARSRNGRLLGCPIRKRF